MTDFNWKEYTDEFNKVSYFQDGPFKATVGIVDSRPENCYANRYWRVGMGGNIIGSGYTFGTEPGRQICEAIMTLWGIGQ